MPDTNAYGLDWDSPIEDDGKEFILLDNGDYVFTVANLERNRFPGSAKIPPCNKATLTLHVDTSDGMAVCKTDLILCNTLEWKISSFFRCIGQKKHGERLNPDWNSVNGAHGKARFKQRVYKKQDGTEGRTNDVDRYYDYDPKYFEGAEMTGYSSDAQFRDLPADDSGELPF